MGELLTIDAPQRHKGQLALFDKNNSDKYPKTILNDGIILEGSNATHGVAYVAHDGAHPLEAEVFLPPYSQGEDVLILPLDSSFSEVPITLNPEVAYPPSEEDIIEIARQALHVHYIKHYWQPAKLRELTLIAKELG